MAMQAQLFSINALANEFRLDRRTMARRLEGLRPAQTEKIGGRTERVWLLADVIRHLERRRKGEASDADIEEIMDHNAEFLFGWLLPRIAADAEFVNHITGWARKELDASKRQALDLLNAVFVFTTVAAKRSIGDGDPIDMPSEGFLADYREAKKAGTEDTFIAKHWPDKKPLKACGAKKRRGNQCHPELTTN